ncbi:hypothetical protein MASR2M48_23230 [Spirochaetota bacterium]
MKKSIVFLAIVAALSFSAMSCGNKEESKTDATNEVASKNDVSYAFGVAIGMSLKDTGVELEYGKFLEGVKDVVEKDNPKIALEDVQTTIQLAITEAMQKIAARNIELETDFLSKNGKKTGVTTTLGVACNTRSSRWEAGPSPSRQIRFA